MRGFHVTMMAILLAALPVGAADVGPDFKIHLTIAFPQGEMTQDVYFIGDRAIEVTGGETDGIYDLSKMTWWDESGGEMTLVKSKEWMQGMADEARQQMAGAPDGPQKSFMQALLEPDFKVTRVDGKVVLENAYFRYEIEPGDAIEAGQARRMYTHSRLNSYRKAMAPRQLPPFAELATIDQMASDGIVPRAMNVRFTTPGGTIESTLKYTYSPVSREEVAKVVSMMAGK